MDATATASVSTGSPKSDGASKRKRGSDVERKLDIDLSVVGFCGCDDTVDPRLLCAISERYDWVEWGILFRKGREGTHKFPSLQWQRDLVEVNHRQRMRLAAHLCDGFVQDVLRGEYTVLAALCDRFGFRRVQINATEANGVDTSSFGDDTVEGIRKCCAALPFVEFIIQNNEETSVICKGLSTHPPPNMSFLFDESKGRGTVASSYPAPPKGIAFGYTGGLGPTNIAKQLVLMSQCAPRHSLWVDMESSNFSSRNVGDSLKGGGEEHVFDVNNVMRCIRAIIDLGLKRE